MVNGERWEGATPACGALFAGLAVAAGAFGAHALRNTLDPPALAIWETAARYQMYHGLALLLLTRPHTGRMPPLLRTAAVLFGAGIVLFSGSLYVLALTGQRWAGAITPIGGVAFLAGWACFAAGCLRPASKS